MTVVSRIIKGQYFDSVSLMLAAREVRTFTGVLDAALVMGTAENKSILRSSGMEAPEISAAGDSDLLVVVKADNAVVAEKSVEAALDILTRKRKKEKGGAAVTKSLWGALKEEPDANLALISVAGRYAAHEARMALEQGLNVMLFSDNVSLEDEIELKKFAHEKGLLVMGPDCGTAIINGLPLAFANVVRPGNIGLIAASGTGLQEVVSHIHMAGGGVSQAIGTGGRDVKNKVGGITFLDAFAALQNHSETHVIVLVSKPPESEVVEKLTGVVKMAGKPVVAIFLGADKSVARKMGAYGANTLEEAGHMAVALSKKVELTEIAPNPKVRAETYRSIVHDKAYRMAKTQKYLRGVFSGGTFAHEALIIASRALGMVRSNITSEPNLKLADAWKSVEHSIVDLGEDEFTVGRPHPMIDYALRRRRIAEEAALPETACILFDVVLGYGSHSDPLSELVPEILEAQKNAQAQKRYIAFVASVTGTELDPQNRSRVVEGLEKIGVFVLPSNASAAECATLIVAGRG
jgi:FdrA protein